MRTSTQNDCTSGVGADGRSGITPPSTRSAETIYLPDEDSLVSDWGQPGSRAVSMKRANEAHRRRLRTSSNVSKATDTMCMSYS